MLPEKPVYVFDTNSLSALKSFYPTRFPAVWTRINTLVSEQRLISSSAVLAEIGGRDKTIALNNWLKENRGIFHRISAEHTQFFQAIFTSAKFRAVLTKKDVQSGRQPADMPLIALARYTQDGCVVTEERWKKDSSKVPNICEDFNLPCTNLEGLMEHEAWVF